MTDNLGELKRGYVLLAVLIGIAVAWFVYSRFSFRQEPASADKTAVIEQGLKETKDEATSLRRRIEDIERRLSLSPPQSSQRTPKRAKAK